MILLQIVSVAGILFAGKLVHDGRMIAGIAAGAVALFGLRLAWGCP